MAEDKGKKAKKDKKKKDDPTDQTIITSITKVSTSKQKRAYLFFLSGPLLGKLFPLNDGITIVGRAPDADIVVNDSRISRNHVQITVDGENVTIEDLGSTNGTFVNGQRVKDFLLKGDDKIQISPATIFKFSLADEDEKIAIDELYELGVIDPLTNVYNKRYFIDRLKEEMSHSKRLSLDLSLLILDIDHFKEVNDTYGHLAGDYVLLTLAKILQSMTRHEDIVARYGGEEFAIVLRNTAEEGSTLLAERIRNTIAGTKFHFENKNIALSVSIGIASFNSKIEFNTYEDLVGAADRCLYYSKEHGRNRTTNLSQVA